MGYNIKHIVLLASLCIAALPVHANARVFAATLEQADWLVTSTRLRCELQQVIPQFGRVRFVHGAGGILRFEVKADNPYHKGVQAELFSVPPGWRTDLKREAMGKVAMAGRSTLIRLDRSMAQQLLFELQGGSQPTFYFTDIADRQKQTEVVVSPAKFQDALTEFEACLTQLEPRGFSHFKRTILDYSAGGELPTEKIEASIDKIVKYLDIDTSIRQIEVSGHSDIYGKKCARRDLSRNRAQHVIDYLLASGVPRKKMIMTYHAEKKPLTKGRSAKTQRKNRRVEVHLRR